MKSIIFILAILFFTSECSADRRVLEQLKSHHRAKKTASKNKQHKKIAKPKSIVTKKQKPKPKPKEIVTSAKLEFRNGLAYLPNEDTPFTGRYEAHHSNGKKYVETKYKQGKKDGLLILWDENGLKVGEIAFENGSQL